MKQSFENLEIRQKSFELAKELWIIFYNKDFKNYSFQDQIMRATLSISNNIAEGNDRGSAKDYIKFLYIAKWSAAEVKNMIYISEIFNYITTEQKETYIEQLSTIINQIWKFIQYLKSKI